ncbi:MAG: translation initiation factor IF-2 [Armatimonadetes bacterium]|nr:translation initiation factor IF-2 [Armatimonadota bacterium]
METMAKVSVQELAKEFEVPSNRLLQVLTELGVPADAAKSGIDQETADTLREMATDLGDELRTIVLPPQITVRELAQTLERTPTEVQKVLMGEGHLFTLTQKLEKELAELVVSEFGLTARWQEPQAQAVVAPKAKKALKTAGMQPRPPVVTILGHVDHGKTSLLDYIRKTKVTEREFGGITQHIGAYQVETDGKLITFLDTPGHAAFTAMRARGAQVTDIAVLVVAADDGVMPQTIEAINHAKNAGVVLMVAINKIDKPEANVEKVRQMLTEYELVPEDWGGKTIMVPVSAITGEGVDKLLEMILLVAEVEDYQADPSAPVEGTVIEAKLDKGRGPLATVLIQQGTLKRSDIINVGNTMGKVRAMLDHKGNQLDKAGPATPVEIIGLQNVPLAGDRLTVASGESMARQIAQERQNAEREEKFKHQQKKKLKLEDVYRHLESDQFKELAVIIKGDVWGSVEAIRDAVMNIEPPENIDILVVHAGVGNVNESDVQLASVANAVILAFNVKVEPKAEAIAKSDGIDVRSYKIIYELLNDIEKALRGLLEPEYEEVYCGTAEIRAVFKLSRGITVAGSYVLDGKIYRGYNARLIREGEVVYDGKVASLRHIKEDVREIAAGYECGINLDDFTAYKVGDKIECYQVRQKELD